MFRATTMIPITLLLLGLFLLTMGFSWIDQQCSYHLGGIDITCFVSYPNWLIVAAVVFLLIGAGSLIWFGTESRHDVGRKGVEERANDVEAGDF